MHRHLTSVKANTEHILSPTPAPSPLSSGKQLPSSLSGEGKQGGALKDGQVSVLQTDEAGSPTRLVLTSLGVLPAGLCTPLPRPPANLPRGQQPFPALLPFYSQHFISQSLTVMSLLPSLKSFTGLSSDLWIS